jgi:disulfide bond formation protein DsbB
MTSFFNSPRFPFFAVSGISLALVVVGVFMAQMLNLAACPLCILQRMLYLLLTLTAILGASVAHHPTGRRLAAAVNVIVAGTGSYVAGYQVWIQRFAPKTNCVADEPWWESFVYWAGDRIPLFFRPSGLCSDPAWKLLGLSIAEWSLLVFTSLALWSLATAVMKRQS